MPVIEVPEAATAMVRKEGADGILARPGDVVVERVLPAPNYNLVPPGTVVDALQRSA